MALKTFDPDQIVFSFALLPIKGWAEDTFINVSRITEAFTSVAGADGEVVRTKSNDNRLRIEVTLMATSDSNDVLSALHNVDLEEPNGAGVGPLSLMDLSGRQLLAEPEAWIANAPDIEYSRSVGSRTWVFETSGEGKRFDGGS